MSKTKKRIWREKLWDRQNARCYYCLTSLTLFQLTIDHVIPTSKNGPDVFENTVGACKRCNTAKGNMSEKEFRETEWLTKKLWSALCHQFYFFN